MGDCQDRGDPSHVPWRGRVLVLFWFGFDWLDGSDGNLLFSFPLVSRQSV